MPLANQIASSDHVIVVAMHLDQNQLGNKSHAII